MKKHIEALEKRRDWLVGRLSNDHPAYGTILDGELLKEKNALDWALGKLTDSTELVMQMDPDTGEVLTEPVEEISIGTSGHYGPVREGDTVEVKIATVGPSRGFAKGEIGIVNTFDRWIGEEFPYIVHFSGGRSAAFARDEIRRVD